MKRSVRIEQADVYPRLEALNLPVDECRDIIERAAGERARCNQNDPLTTPGTETWRWMTRFLRENPNLRASGWVRCTHRGVDGLRHDGLKIKLVATNMDHNAGNPDKMPKTSSEKGAVAETAVKKNLEKDQLSLWEVEPAEDPIDDYDFWYFGVYISDHDVRAELSRPIDIASKIVRDYSERIIVLKAGDMPTGEFLASVPEDFAEFDKPQMKRKSD